MSCQLFAFTFTLRRLLAVVTLVALLLGAWHLLKEDALSWWNRPAGRGKIVIAIRVDNEDLTVLEEVESLLLSSMPFVEPMDGNSRAYDALVRTGFSRLERGAHAFDDLQHLCDDADAIIQSHFAAQRSGRRVDVCVVDENGVVFYPTRKKLDGVEKGDKSNIQ